MKILIKIIYIYTPKIIILCIPNKNIISIDNSTMLFCYKLFSE